MTIPQILENVSAVKPCSRVQLYTYLRGADIQPVGARQRPQNYPDDSVIRILKHLGLYEKAKADRIAAIRNIKLSVAPEPVRALANGTEWKTPRKLVTTAQLRKARKQGRGK